ncbi:unnamed protein product [Spirodela intermedia]|uniref:Legume lectin domain-containing protein n=1 Tax=Spirodela intermedia TaxID=51605 RepID=A0A7I8J876_SPIIN|nr:unnamed protein product [Spirodela intermedia]CAA6666428.1 unnamed protein product [Spirodela intermedia]
MYSSGEAKPPPPISFPSFPRSSCDAGDLLRCMQNSSVTDGYLCLVPEENRRVLYNRPAIMWPSNYDTNFTVLIRKRPNATYFGDGMAFVMTTDMRQSPRKHRRFFGLFDQSTNAWNTTGQLAVEIDTVPNEYEIQEYHVGVDIASIVSNITAPPSKANVDLNREIPVTYRVNYDGWTKKLEVSAGYAGQEPLKSVLNFSIVIAKIDPIYVGFTAASGPSLDASESIRVLSWNFSSTPLPDSKHRVGTILAIILSIPFGVILLGLLILLGVRKWRR